MPKYADNNALQRWAGHITDLIDGKKETEHTHNIINDIKVVVSNTVPTIANANTLTLFCEGLDIQEPPSDQLDFSKVFKSVSVRLVYAASGEEVESATAGDTTPMKFEITSVIDTNEFEDLYSYLASNNYDGPSFGGIGYMMSQAYDGENVDYQLFLTLFDEDFTVETTANEANHTVTYRSLWPTINDPPGYITLESSDDELIKTLKLGVTPGLSTIDGSDIIYQLGDAVTYKLPYEEETAQFEDLIFVFEGIDDTGHDDVRSPGGTIMLNGYYAPHFNIEFNVTPQSFASKHMDDIEVHVYDDWYLTHTDSKNLAKYEAALDGPNLVLSDLEWEHERGGITRHFELEAQTYYPVSAKQSENQGMHTLRAELVLNGNVLDSKTVNMNLYYQQM